MTQEGGRSVVVIGAGCAGLPAAFRLRHALGRHHRVTVIDKNEEFTFNPSLIWVPFGWRRPEQITVPLRPVLEKSGIEFMRDEVVRIEPESGHVATASGRVRYDRLLIATGPQLQFSAVPGLGPDGGYTQCIASLRQAAQAKAAWEKFLSDPGPVIVGAAQGASFLGAAYDFVFNLEYALRRRLLRDKVKITFLTPEPYVGHFGLGRVPGARGLLEWFFRHTDIDWVVQSMIDKVAPGEIHLRQGSLRRCYDRDDRWENLSGKSLGFKYAMIFPPFLGAEAVRRSGLGNQDGFIVVDDYFRHKRHPAVFAAGVCVAVTAPEPNLLACAVPQTGYISGVMARIAAGNIAADILGKPLTPRPVGALDEKYVFDAGDQGLMLFIDRAYAPRLRRRRMLIPGWWAHWAKVLFEKYYLWKTRTGRSHWR